MPRPTAVADTLFACVVGPCLVAVLVDAWVQGRRWRASQRRVDVATAIEVALRID